MYENLQSINQSAKQSFSSLSLTDSPGVAGNLSSDDLDDLEHLCGRQMLGLHEDAPDLATELGRVRVEVAQLQVRSEHALVLAQKGLVLMETGLRSCKET